MVYQQKNTKQYIPDRHDSLNQSCAPFLAKQSMPERPDVWGIQLRYPIIYKTIV